MKKPNKYAGDNAIKKACRANDQYLDNGGNFDNLLNIVVMDQEKFYDFVDEDVSQFLKQTEVKSILQPLAKAMRGMWVDGFLTSARMQGLMTHPNPYSIAQIAQGTAATVQLLDERTTDKHVPDQLDYVAEQRALLSVGHVLGITFKHGERIRLGNQENALYASLQIMFLRGYLAAQSNSRG